MPHHTPDTKYQVPGYKSTAHLFSTALTHHCLRGPACLSRVPESQRYMHCSMPRPINWMIVHIRSQFALHIIAYCLIALVCLMFHSVVTLNNCGLFNLFQPAVIVDGCPFASLPVRLPVYVYLYLSG